MPPVLENSNYAPPVRRLDGFYPPKVATETPYQLLMIVQTLIVAGDAYNALDHQLLDAMIYQLGIIPDDGINKIHSPIQETHVAKAF